MLSPQGLPSCLSSIRHLRLLHCSSCRNLLPVPPTVSMYCLLPSPLLFQDRPSAPAPPTSSAPRLPPPYHPAPPKPSLTWDPQVAGTWGGPGEAPRAGPRTSLCPCLSISWAVSLSLLPILILSFPFLLSSSFYLPTHNRCTATWLKARDLSPLCPETTSNLPSQLLHLLVALPLPCCDRKGPSPRPLWSAGPCRPGQ